MSDLANRSLPSIEGSDRSANPEMNPLLLRQGPMNPMDWIVTELELDWEWIGSSKIGLIGRFPL